MVMDLAGTGSRISRAACALAWLVVCHWQSDVLWLQPFKLGHPERSAALGAQSKDPVEGPATCRRKTDFPYASPFTALPVSGGISVAPPTSSPALSRKASALRLRFARLSTYAPLRMTDVRCSAFY